MRTRSEEPGFAVSTSGSSGNASMADRAGLHQAPRLLPLLHRMEEREEVRFHRFPLSSVLAPRSSRGEDGELDAALADHAFRKHASDYSGGWPGRFSMVNRF